MGLLLLSSFSTMYIASLCRTKYARSLSTKDAIHVYVPLVLSIVEDFTLDKEDQHVLILLHI